MPQAGPGGPTVRRVHGEDVVRWLLLRVLILAVAVPGIVGCVAHVKVHQQATAEVTGSGTRQSCTTDSNGARSCTT